MTRQERKRFRERYRRMCRTQLSNKPTRRQILAYRKALRRHRIDPIDNQLPGPLRGWYVEPVRENQP